MDAALAASVGERCGHGQRPHQIRTLRPGIGRLHGRSAEQTRKRQQPARNNRQPRRMNTEPQASAVIATRDSHLPGRGWALPDIFEIFVFEGGVATNQEGWCEVINQALPRFQEFANVLLNLPELLVGGVLDAVKL